MIVNTLKAHKRTQAKWRLAAGEAWQNFNLVCCLEDGRPINPPSLSGRFSDLAERLGYPYTFHSLRHFHASALIKAGVPIKVISERLGHSSVSVTMDIYGHLLPGVQKEAAYAFEQLLSKNGL